MFHGHGPGSIICTNCGQAGHVTKHCTLPITSYGVILFRPGPQILLIRRRDSISFVEIMRGKYKVADTDYVKCLLLGMTADEQQRILHTPFDALWEELWGPPLDSRHLYRSERESSRAKLEQLRNGGQGQPPLRDLIAEVGSQWTTPEWGFPKGRRDPHESEYACAMRELWEETGFKESDFQIIKNLDPLTEQFRGSNGVQYCHKYYIGRVLPAAAQRELVITPEMKQEVGEIRWVTEEEGLACIRPENPEKRELLRDVGRLLRTYCATEIRGA